MKSEKKIFLACAIGDENSDTRRHADLILTYLVRDAIQNNAEFDGISVIRADEIAQPGKITTQIMTMLTESAVCVAEFSPG